MHQDMAIRSIPQADGDGRTFRAVQPRQLVHVERSGPAFAREFVPLLVADQFGASLVAQTTIAIGDVLRALDRQVMLDLMPAWSRLIRVEGLSLPLSYLAPRQKWAWIEMREAVVLALAHAGDGLVYWIRADALIRGFAQQCAEQCDEADLLACGPMELSRLTANRAAFAAFVGGK